MFASETLKNTGGSQKLVLPLI